MSRSTQYIGLNKAAVKFLEEFGELVETYHMTEGMFEEPVRGGIYRLCSGRVAREVEQVCPWSSGPMIFTCLEIDGVMRFRWKEDESQRGWEYDRSKGLYWV